MICIQPFHSSVWSRWSGLTWAWTGSEGEVPPPRRVKSASSSIAPLTPQKAHGLTYLGPLATSVVRSHR